MWKAIEEFISGLQKVLREPPYILFLFIGGIYVVIALIFQKSFEQVWFFFLYAVGGTMWRYAERDFRSESGERTLKVLGKEVRYKLITYMIYHAGNILLFLFLLDFLGII